MKCSQFLFIANLGIITPAKIYSNVYNKSRKSVNDASKHSIGAFLLKMYSKSNQFGTMNSNSKSNFKRNTSEGSHELYDFVNET